MASNLDEGTAFIEELEEGEIDDDEDDEVMCLLDVGTPRFVSSNGRPQTNIVPRNTLSRNNKLYNDVTRGSNRSFPYPRTDPSGLSRVQQISNCSMSSVNERKRPIPKYRNRNQPLQYRESPKFRYHPRQNSGITSSYRPKTSYRPRMSDYSYKRQRLLTSIRQRSMKKRIQN